MVLFYMLLTLVPILAVQDGTATQCADDPTQAGPLCDDKMERARGAAARLHTQAMRAGEASQRQALLRQGLALDPWRADSLLQLGLSLINDPEQPTQHRTGFLSILRAFDERARPSVPRDSVMGLQLVAFLAKQPSANHTEREFLLKIAIESQSQEDDCAAVTLATMLPKYPASEQAAQEALQLSTARMEALLQRPNLSMPLPGRPDNDLEAYDMCFFLGSHIMHTYYQDPTSRFLPTHFALAMKAFPRLHHTAAFLLRPVESESESKPKEAGRKAAPLGRKLRLGFASAAFQGVVRFNSVLNFMAPMFDRLDRSRFDVSLIYIQEDTGSVQSPYFDQRAEIDTTVVIKNEAGWLERGRQQIEALELDLLVYVDCLSHKGHTFRLAVGRLARAQACSMGTITSSGIPPPIMDYYIGWGGHELPLEESKKFYSEELVLIPSNVMQVYLEPKVVAGRSVLTGQAYGGVSRNDFSDWINAAAQDQRWYLCMQLPFKRHAAFDGMMAAILNKDPQGRLVLIAEPFSRNDQAVLVARMALHGVDLSRVHFLPKLPHHLLLALYSLADVIIDSYYAGSGTTTATEAFEVGGLIVSLPHQMHMSRYVGAFYRHMGFEDDFELLAKDRDDYVEIAVRVASSPELRAALRARVLQNAHKLFHQDDSVQAWQDTLERLATKAIGSIADATGK